jgi:hypothetical protein
LTSVTVTNAFPASRGGDAAALVFEYMAATQAENGRPVPDGQSRGAVVTYAVSVSRVT